MRWETWLISMILCLPFAAGTAWGQTILLSEGFESSFPPSPHVSPVRR